MEHTTFVTFDVPDMYVTIRMNLSVCFVTHNGIRVCFPRVRLPPGCRSTKRWLPAAFFDALSSLKRVACNPSGYSCLHHRIARIDERMTKGLTALALFTLNSGGESSRTKGFLVRSWWTCLVAFINAPAVYVAIQPVCLCVSRHAMASRWAPATVCRTQFPSMRFTAS